MKRSSLSTKNLKRTLQGIPAAALLLLVSLLLAGNTPVLLAQTQIGTGFDGPTGLDTWWWPNDPNAATGPNHVMQIINGIYRIYTKDGTLVGSGHIDNLFTNLNPSVSTLDPNIMYDNIAGRFVLEANGSGTDITNAYIAVSDTSDPTAGFTEVHVLSFPGANDGSKAGFNADVYVICATSGTAIMDKSSMLDRNNGTFTVLSKTTSTYGRAARMYGAAPGAPMYFTAASGGAIRVTRADNVTTATPTYTSYNVAGSSGCTDPATPSWRNNSLVTANTGAMYWWQVDTSGTTPVLTQQGLISAPSGYVFGYGSACIAPNGDIGMSYMQYSATTNNPLPVSMWVAWRAAADTLGTTRTPIMAVSSAPLTQVNARHGDFSSTVCDLDTNGNTLNAFWSCNGYIKPNGTGTTEASWNQNFGGPLTAPAILNQPQNLLVVAGNPASFTVSAGGAAPFGYQWQKGGVNIAGATNSTYTIASTTTDDTGSYAVVVTNSLGSATSSTATLTVIGPLSPTGNWTFNDGNGTVATDSSGFGNNGTLMGNGGATWVTGFSGTGIQFNGTSNWVAFGTGPSVAGTNNFTVAAWIKTTAATAGVVIQQRDSGFNGEYGFDVNANGTLQFFVYGSSAYEFNFATTAAVNDGNWHHVVAVRNGLAGNIYIDGALAATATGTAVSPLLSTIGTYVGRDVRNNNNNFDGIIDEVLEYNATALTATDVSNLYNSYLSSPPPPAPTALAANGGNAVVNLTWTQSTGTGITGNNVYRSTTGSGGPYNLLANLAATTSYADTAVVNGNTYFYSVTAINGNGESALSSYAGATTIPAAPTGLSATAGNAQVGLSWTASTGATGYNVKRATTSGGPYTTIASPTGSSYTDTTAANGTTYYYVVSAVNASGESVNSSEVSATPSAPPPPAAPTSLTASAGHKKVTLAWTQSTSPNIVSNKVYRATVNGGPYTLVATLAATTTYANTGLTSGTTYYYVVTAVNNSSQESSYSNQASATAK